jgi:hypothetical protein
MFHYEKFSGRVSRERHSRWSEENGASSKGPFLEEWKEWELNRMKEEKKKDLHARVKRMDTKVSGDSK